MSTIFALSSGLPPAAIAVVRISGPAARGALESLCGRLPTPRRASLASLHAADGTLLDHALALWFPGPLTATGEDLAELHLHGGRAVVRAVESALAAMAGLRRAEPGEFTRRSFVNGRLDLAEAEGLADLLSAETELQRRNAMALANGAFSSRVEAWRSSILSLSAQLEAVLDFEDEDDVASLSSSFFDQVNRLSGELSDYLDAPHAERLKEGFRVALAGPPNAGKSTLFNALVGSEAAITSSIEGTTRDVIERSVALDGVPVNFIDMAGLRGSGAEEIEAIGIERAYREIEQADLVLWLGAEGEGPDSAWEIESQIDRAGPGPKKVAPDYRVSPVSGEGMADLRQAIADVARESMPKPGEVALNTRQRGLIGEARRALADVIPERDLLLVGEDLRIARHAFDRLVGRSTTEDMLDTLFGRFCIGK